jgi:hypothetical protein
LKTLAEKNELVTNCDRFESWKHSSVLPYTFTKYGVAMLLGIFYEPVFVPKPEGIYFKMGKMHFIGLHLFVSPILKIKRLWPQRLTRIYESYYDRFQERICRPVVACDKYLLHEARR